jgi:hypothetical protein
MVGMRMSHHHRVNPRDTRIKELFTEIWGSVDKDNHSADFHQH